MMELTHKERSPGRRRHDRILGLVENIVDDTEVVSMIRRTAEIVCQEMRAERATIYHEEG